MDMTYITPTCKRFIHRLHEHAHDVYILVSPVLWTHEILMGFYLGGGILVVMLVQAFVDECKEMGGVS